MKNSNTIYLISLGILLSIFRFYINGMVNDETLVFIMAVINAVAFNYIIVLIINDVRKEVGDKLEKSSLPIEQQIAGKKIVNLISRIISCIIFIIFSAIYIIIFRSSTLNDILAIMALVISISQNQLSTFFGELIYNKI